MIQKINTTATERNNLFRSSLHLRNFLLDRKKEALNDDIFIPDDLIAEIEEFANRNGIPTHSILSPEKPIYRCCPKCLKAHAIKSAKKMGLSKESVGYLSDLFSCESGHNGYYMDEDSLKKCDVS